MNYLHNMDAPNRHTFAYEPILAEDIETLILNMLDSKDNAKLNVKYGIARCHPKDVYNKKLGREIAEAKIANRIVEVREIHIHSNIVTIEAECSIDYALIQFTYIKGNKNAKISWSTLYYDL